MSAGGPSVGRPAPVPGWKELRFAARKAGISATIEIRLDQGTDDPTKAILLESTTHLPGRTFVARERVDPVLAGASEIVDTETGARHHRKTYSLRERGFELDVLEPASLTEMLLPPERWTRRNTSFAAYPRALAAGTTITGPAGLLICQLDCRPDLSGRFHDDSRPRSRPRWSG